MSDDLWVPERDFLTVLQYLLKSEASTEVAESVFGTEELVLVALESATSG